MNIKDSTLNKLHVHSKLNLLQSVPKVGGDDDKDGMSADDKKEQERLR